MSVHEKAIYRHFRAQTQPLDGEDMRRALAGTGTDPRVGAVRELIARHWQECQEALTANPARLEERSREFNAGAAAALEELMEELDTLLRPFDDA